MITQQRCMQFASLLVAQQQCMQFWGLIIAQLQRVQFWCLMIAQQQHMHLLSLMNRSITMHVVFGPGSLGRSNALNFGFGHCARTIYAALVFDRCAAAHCMQFVVLARRAAALHAIWVFDHCARAMYAALVFDRCAAAVHAVFGVGSSRSCYACSSRV